MAIAVKPNGQHFCAVGESKAPHLVPESRGWMSKMNMVLVQAEEQFYGLKSKTIRQRGRINMIAGYQDGQLIAPSLHIWGGLPIGHVETWLKRA